MKIERNIPHLGTTNNIKNKEESLNYKQSKVTVTRKRLLIKCWYFHFVESFVSQKRNSVHMAIIDEVALI